jgi:hypothetical protein
VRFARASNNVSRINLSLTEISIVQVEDIDIARQSCRKRVFFPLFSLFWTSP